MERCGRKDRKVFSKVKKKRFKSKSCENKGKAENKVGGKARKVAKSS